MDPQLLLARSRRWVLISDSNASSASCSSSSSPPSTSRRDTSAILYESLGNANNSGSGSAEYDGEDEAQRTLQATLAIAGELGSNCVFYALPSSCSASQIQQMLESDLVQRAVVSINGSESSIVSPSLDAVGVVNALCLDGKRILRVGSCLHESFISLTLWNPPELLPGYIY